MKNKIIQDIILLAVTIFVFLLFAEIATRFYAHYSPSFLCNTYSNLDDHYLCSLEFSLSKSFEAYNLQNFQFDKNICDKWDAELGWVPNPNCISIKNSVKYSTNSEGFRGAKEFSLEKKKSRVVIVGDSFTWGENNNDNETYPYYLDKFFNGSADVINMGVHGYGPDQFYLYFMRNGIRYNPDVVVFGLFLPDIHRTILKIGSYFKPRFILDDGKLRIDSGSSPTPDIETALATSRNIKKKSRLYSISYLFGMYSKFYRLASGYEKETLITLDIIKMMDKDLKSHNIKLIVVLIPEQGMVEKGNSDYYGVVPKITRSLEQEGIDYINMQPAFRNETDSTKKSLYDGHTNTHGNMVIAGELHSFLIAKMNQNK